MAISFFFHVDSDPNSYVYHVAIYEGGNQIVSAIDPSQGIAWQDNLGLRCDIRHDHTLSAAPVIPVILRRQLHASS